MIEPSSLPDTRLTLLQRLPDTADVEAWESFVKIYGPVIFGFAVKRGCPASEAADLVQEVMITIAGAIRRFEYDRSKGRFRNWLFTIAKNQLIRRYRKASVRPQTTDPEQSEEILDRVADGHSDPDQIWEMEYQRQIAYHALPLVKAKVSEAQWMVFEAIVIGGRPAGEIAEEMNLSLGAVYVAKSRILARLKEEVDRLEQEWDEATSERNTER